MAHLKALEILWIVLFRFPPVPRLWAAALIAVNLGALFFLNTADGPLALLAALYTWAVVLTVFNNLSLIIDTSDMIRYLRGEREPHCTW